MYSNCQHDDGNPTWIADMSQWSTELIQWAEGICQYRSQIAQHRNAIQQAPEVSTSIAYALEQVSREAEALRQVMLAISQGGTASEQ